MLTDDDDVEDDDDNYDDDDDDDRMIEWPYERMIQCWNVGLLEWGNEGKIKC